MLGRAIAISLTVSVVVLSVLLATTKPATIGPLGILVVFILMYVSALGVLTFLLFGISKIIGKIYSSVGIKRPVETLTLRRSYYFSSVIALAPVMFIGMQSVDEVSVYDVLLVGLFVLVSCVYISKRTS
jgi:hypothetical protein